MKRGLWLLLVPLWCPGCAPASERTDVDLPLYNALVADASTTGDSDPECQDSDEDTLCDDEELMLGTDPYDRDTDGDALDDGLEVHGYTQDGRTLDLKALGANPRRKDIFLEIHYMPGWRPLPEAIEDVQRAFLSAPVTNHDGSTGIHLHVEITKEIPFIEMLLPVNALPELAAMKSMHFDALRTVAFHYGVFGNRLGENNYSGLSNGIGGADFLVTLGGHNLATYTMKRQKQAGTLMHELGHNLGLHHGGKPDNRPASDDPWQPHHFSVMNYTYQLSGVHRDGVDTIDYARTSTRALTESSLDEVAAFSVNKSSPDPELLRITNPRICTWFTPDHGCRELTTLSGSAGQNLDLNRSNGIQAVPVQADLNGNGLADSFDALLEEWNALDYRGGGVIGERDRIRRREIDSGEPVTCQSPLNPEVVTTSEPETPEP